MKLAYLIILAVLFMGCSSGAADVRTGSNVAGRAPVQTPPTYGNNSSASAEAPNSNSDFAQRAANRTHGKANVVVNGTPAPLEFRPGPENSELATTMNAEGQPVEVRVFKSDPLISRVEATWLDPRQKLLRITLRNGKVLDVRTDSVSSLGVVSAAELATLAGASK